MNEANVTQKYPEPATKPVRVRLPEDVHAELKADAQRSLRTINAQLVYLLRERYEKGSNPQK